VPSRARLFGSVCVGHQLSVDDVGESPFEAAPGFQRGLAGGELAPVVGAALGVVAQLDYRGDVQNVVHPPVPGPRQPVPDLLAGGCVQGGGAGPGG
jgi:hypothetical protein